MKLFSLYVLLISSAAKGLLLPLFEKSPKIATFKITTFKWDNSCRGCKYLYNKKCSKFLRIVDGVYVDYDYALMCRLDETKCGPYGKYFIESN